MGSRDLAGFLAHVEEGYNVIPLFETLQLDRETPVSLYQRFNDGRAIFMLESAALAEETGRYSFIGLDRKWRVRSYGERTIVEGAKVTREEGPLETIRSLLHGYRVLLPSELPDFFGGAVGFVAYDYVRRLETLPKAPVKDMWPDVDFSFPVRDARVRPPTSLDHGRRERRTRGRSRPRGDLSRRHEAAGRTDRHPARTRAAE